MRSEIAKLNGEISAQIVLPRDDSDVLVASAGSDNSVMVLVVGAIVVALLILISIPLIIKKHRHNKSIYRNR